MAENSTIGGLHFLGIKQLESAFWRGTASQQILIKFYD
jgi:hypothetical protein